MSEAAGIALVPQEINVLSELTVAENITLNDEPTRWGVIDVARRLQIAKEAVAEFGLDVEPEYPDGVARPCHTTADNDCPRTRQEGSPTHPG